MVDVIFEDLSPLYESLYAKSGCPSAAPEKLLRAFILQVFFTVRSERLLMEQLDCILLFC
jgi:transposase